MRRSKRRHPPRRPGRRSRRSPHGAKRARSRNNFRPRGPLCPAAKPLWSGARQASRSALRHRTVCQDEHGPKGPNCARCHGGRHRACGRGSRRRSFACPPPRHRIHPVRRRGRGASTARRAATAEGGLAAGAQRRRGADGRQAEPGAAPGPLEILDVARDRRGEEGRGRCRGLGRQHRRPDGDGEVQPAHHGGHRAPGDRRRLADASRATRWCSMSAPRSARTPSIWSTLP